MHDGRTAGGVRAAQGGAGTPATGPGTAPAPLLPARAPGPAVIGALWMIAGMSAIAIVDGAAKVLAGSLHGMQVAWGYFLVMLVCLLLVAVLRRAPPAQLLRSYRPRLQAARACCLVLSLSCLFFSLRFLPLAEATTIAFTAPLFIVALSGPMLGERVGIRRWAAVLSGLVGALVVMRPGLGVLHWSAMLALVGAFFFAQFNIVTRMLGATDRPMTTLFHTFAIGTVLLSLAMPLVWIAPSAREWLIFASSGALGLFAHYAIYRSLMLADASVVAPLNYVRLVWAIGIGVVVFGDVPDAMTLLGGAITIASGLYVLLWNAR
jgi:drug/metabolite transporter (DMT)-like permease